MYFPDRVRAGYVQMIRILKIVIEIIIIKCFTESDRTQRFCFKDFNSLNISCL